MVLHVLLFYIALHDPSIYLINRYMVRLMYIDINIDIVYLYM